MICVKCAKYPFCKKIKEKSFCEDFLKETVQRKIEKNSGNSLK